MNLLCFDKFKKLFYQSEIRYISKNVVALEEKVSDLGNNLFLHKEIVKKRELPEQEFIINEDEKRVQCVQNYEGNMKNLYKIASSFLSDKQLSFLGYVFNEMARANLTTQSSVSLLSESNKKINEKYKMLIQIDLLSHTINVLNKLILHSSELSSQNKTILFFSALFHDLGKSKTLVSKLENHYYGVFGVTDRDNHSKFSALIFKQFLDQNNSNTFAAEIEDLIFHTIFYHHDYDSKEIEGVVVGLIKFLIKIDIEARKDEAAFIKFINKEENHDYNRG